MAWGCGGADSSTTLADTGSGDGSSTASVAPGMRALLDVRCVGCHQPGGTGRGDYTIDAEVLQRRASIGTAVAARTMPPWMPDPSCGSFDGDLSLSEAELALVADWAAGGEPQTSVSPEESALPELGPPDISLIGAESYQPIPEELTDRTVCHKIGPVFTTETLLRAIAFRLSHPELVHHLVLLAIPESELVATPQSGAGTYSCDTPNTLRLGFAIQLATPYLLPAGVAVPIPAGHLLLLQVHYSIAALPAGDPIPQVTSALDLWTTSAAEARPLSLLAGSIDDLVVGAGDANGSAASETRIDRSQRVYALMPHMHVFGTAFSATLRRANGTQECLISIPSWRFLEQRIFFRPPGDELLLSPGDTISFRCSYDNSAENQPLVRGVRGEPRDLTAGWRSVDEMCEFNLFLTER
jgi:mono/diheme cytochrome c family protein